MFGVSFGDLKAGLRRLVKRLQGYAVDPLLISMPNVYAQTGIEICAEAGHPINIHHEPYERERENMPRTASKDKVGTVGVESIADMNAWQGNLEQIGFRVQSFQYDVEGAIVSATCTKNERDQVITPELYAVLTDN